MKMGTQENYIYTEENDGVLLSISVSDGDWIESKPTGSSNLAVCNNWIDKFKPTFTTVQSGGSKSA